MPMPIDVTVGTIVAGYRIERELGRGASGAVYLARDEHLDRPAALKLLSAELASDERFRERFLRESRIVARLDHPSVVPVYAAGEFEGRLYLAMRYVDGGDLGEAIELEGRLEPSRTLSLLRQVADALDAAHAEGLIHRDVKPGNILVGAGDRAYLADFGLAKHATTVQSLSRDSPFSGTIAYVAPEQIQGGAVDGRCDVYALGCVAFQCLTGRTPFDRDTDVAVVLAHLQDAPPAVSALRPDLPSAVDAVIGRALAKRPDDRYATCAELFEDAAAALGGAELAPREGRAHLRTFLIADVRGYTRYTQEHGDEAGAALAAAFADLVGRTVAEHGGRLIELRGDEALVGFDSARSALRAALAVQTQVDEADLPRGVGIGLDAGEAVPVGAGYRGGALNMAARLCALARPGQVLATDGVVHLARAVDGVRYLEGRLDRLKGIDHPVRVVEVVPAQRGDAVLRRLRRRVQGRRWIPALALGLCAAGAVAAGVLFAGGGTPAQAGPPGKLHTIAVFDARTLAYEGAVPVGANTFDQQGDGRWLWSMADGELLRIDPHTRRVLHRYPVGNVNGWTVGAGSAWLTSADHRWVLRVDPKFDTIEKIRLPANGGFGDGIAVGGGSIWVAQGEFDAAVVRRLSLRTFRVQASIPFVGASAVRYGDGAVFVANPVTGEIIKIDPATNEQAWSSRLHPWLADILPAAGYLWVTVDSDAGVYRMDERTGTQVGPLVHTGNGSGGLGFGDGRVWVANNRAGTVTRVDPVSGDTATVAVGNAPIQAGVEAGRVWVGMAPRPPDVAKTLHGDVAHFVLREDWLEQIDPAIAWASRKWELEYATEAKLYNYHDPDASHTGSELAPEIAAAFPRISADRRTYTMTVRRGFRFSPPSGRPVTAETVRSSIERALSPDLGDFRPASFYLTDLVGEPAYLNGKAPHIRGLSVDGSRLVMRFTTPKPDLAEILAMPFFAVVPEGTPASGFDVQAHPIPSAGPYYLSYDNGGWQAVLRRNPNYHGSRPHRLDAVVYEMGINTGPAARRVEQGTLDYASEEYPDYGVFAPGLAISRTYGASPRRRGRPWYTSIPEPGTRFLVFNTGHGIFRDVRWRRAVNKVLDRPALAAGGGGPPTDHYLPPMPGVRTNVHVYPVGRPTAADIAKARALVGHRTTHALLETCLQPDCDARARILKRDLARIGVRLTVRSFNSVQATSAPRSDILDTGWFLDEYDPINVLGPIFDTQSPYYAPFQDPHWRRRVEAAAALPPPARFRAFGGVELGLMRHAAPWAAYTRAAVPAFFSARLGCIRFSPVYSGPDIAGLCINGR
ncbi:MAG TPA: ABC transporter substrate-binding protein [Gaiellales bacterium]|nr:ABC transporter substrate-binding protein [Gaiellales bacterium]